MQFKCREVTVSVGFPFAAAVTLMFLYDTSGTAVISVCAALLHEIGHLLCLFWYGETPQSLKLGLAERMGRRRAPDGGGNGEFHACPF